MIKKYNQYVMMKFKDDLFAKAMDDISKRRVLEGVDNKTRPRTEIAEAIARGLLNETLESFKAVKKDLITGKFKGKNEQ